MYARTVTAQAQPGKVEEAMSIYRNSIVPAAKEQKGFKGAFFLVDNATGKSVSLTLWDTEADMQAAEASGFLREQIAKLGATLATAPVSEHFEVVAQG